MNNNEACQTIAKTPASVKFHGLVKDITGKRFGRLLVVGLSEKRGKRQEYFWAVKCDCGVEKIVMGHALHQGKTVSCGCLRDELVTARRLKHGCGRHGKYGAKKTAEYRAWCGMNQRCNNPKNVGFKDYGGRGIVICKRWKVFDNFLKDMGLKPSPRHSIDRKNVNGNYEPANCRWGSVEQQSNNTRRSRAITHKGRTLTLMQWCVQLDLSYAMIRYRLIEGESFESAISRQSLRTTSPLG